MTACTYSPAELGRFREVQRLAYRCAEEVAAELHPGITEKDAAARLGDRLRLHGVRHFFHQPFAWFGSRTAFRGIRQPLQFFPTDRRLELGMPAILDVAPIVDGYAADIGYAFACGDNPALAQLVADLEGFRACILACVSRGDTLADIYRAADDLVADLGVVNCHRHYPFGVLAHRVYHQPVVPMGQVRLLGFGLGSGVSLLAQKAFSRVPARLARLAPRLRQGSSFCNTGPGSDLPPEPGLWAFEPHIARGDVGAKWEELLVIEPRRAYWLDDDLPHVRQWHGTPARAAGE